MTVFRLFAACVLVLTAVVGTAASSHAQLRPVLTISNGIGQGLGAFHTDRTQLSLDGFFGVRSTRSTKFSPLVGAYAGATFTTGGDLVLNCSAIEQRGCTTPFPPITYIGLAVGGEARKKYVGLALLGGPGAFHVDDNIQPNNTLVGAMIRGDVNFYVGQHFQWVLSGITRRVANYRDGLISVNTIGVGIRVQ